MWQEFETELGEIEVEFDNVIAIGIHELVAGTYQICLKDVTGQYIYSIPYQEHAEARKVLKELVFDLKKAQIVKLVGLEEASKLLKVPISELLNTDN